MKTVRHYNDQTQAYPGGARWAEAEEMKATLSPVELDQPHMTACGLPFLCEGRTVYVDNSDSHSLILGATGSKKTRLMVMPTMQMIAKAGESVVCTDPKSELYDMTSGLFAANGYDVYVLNLRDPMHSHGYSFLHAAVEAYRHGEKDRAYGMLGDLATTLFPPSRSHDRFWEDTCRSLFEGLSGMVVERFKLYGDYTLDTMQQLMDNLGQYDDDNETNILMDSYPSDSPSVCALKKVITGSDRTWDNIRVSYYAGTHMIYSRRSLVNLLSTPELDFTSIGMKKTAVFIILPDESTTLYGIASLLIKQMYEHLIHQAQLCPNHTLPVRVNFMLDEFCNIPCLPDFSAMMSAARSRNLRFFLVVQSYHQLVNLYGEAASTIKGNCNNWVYLFSRELAMLQEISDLCGVSARSGRPLITITQLQHLSKEDGQALLMVGREYPYMTNLPDISQYNFPVLSPKPLPTLPRKPYTEVDLLEIEREIRRQRAEKQAEKAKAEQSKTLEEIIERAAHNACNNPNRKPRYFVNLPPLNAKK